MKKPFLTYNGVDYNYPEVYSALFGSDIPGLAQAALDQLRIVEQREKPECKSEFCRYFTSVELKSGQKFEANCRSWRCERCRHTWGRKWSALISEQLESTPANLLVNLTTAEMIDHQVLENALRRFIKAWRRAFGPTEYIKVVEYNKRHTQPHFHLIFCCKEYKPEAYPHWWSAMSEDKQRKFSWPEDTWEFISGMWGEALAFYAPTLKPTVITWCQPVHSGPAATKYAVGYVTGKSQKDGGKNEEPDSTWKGRKLTYSKKFFATPTAKIWAKLLERWFPDRPKDPVFGMLINPDECEQSGLPLHLLTPSVRQKLSLTNYWQSHQELPRGMSPPPLEIIENNEGELEFSFDAEFTQIKKPGGFPGGRLLKWVRSINSSTN